jgi:hypothetical protein
MAVSRDWGMPPGDTGENLIDSTQKAMNQADLRHEKSKVD